MSRACEGRSEDLYGKKVEAKVASQVLPNGPHVVDDYDDIGYEDYENEMTMDGSSSQKSVRSRVPPKRARVKGPMDLYVNPKAHPMKEGGIHAACDKELRERTCRSIARFFYDAGIAFHAATYPSFLEMCEAIGQYGPGLKAPSMHELRVPLLRKEVDDTQKEMDEYKKEWATKGCSIMSDGWRDSASQKDIVNFLVNSPKGSVFIKSMDVSDYVKDANMLFNVLDDMVEEVGEENVIQVVTDNASNYVKAGNKYEFLFFSFL